jgi:glutamyl-tRNA reductase
MFHFGTGLALDSLQLALEVLVVEPMLMVIGLNHRTAPLAMRERFWIGDNRRYDVLRQLKCAEGIEEVVAVSNWRRTEFWMWANEPTLAANSVTQFLTSAYGLKLSEWQHFYRLIDDAALSHVFRVISGLDALPCRESEIVSQVNSACDAARTVGSMGPFLNFAVNAGMGVALRVEKEMVVDNSAPSLPETVCKLALKVFGDLDGRRIVLLGASEVSELAAKTIMTNRAGSVLVIDQSFSKARSVAERVSGTAATLADRWKSMLRADIVITATGCPHVVLAREEAERIAAERNRVALVIVDLGMPRDVDPEVRRVDGILLYDLEGLERIAKEGLSVAPQTAEAEKILSEEVRAFGLKLQCESLVPTIVALRLRLEEICRQDLESFIQERGPFTREQDHALHAITTQVIQKIASSLVRELKEVPEREEQERMTTAVTRLFHLEPPKTALAGTSSERKNERTQERAAAIH